MAHASAEIKTARPSFAKVAAAGLRPSGAQSNPSQLDRIQKSVTPSSPCDGASSISPPTQPKMLALSPDQKKVVAIGTGNSKESDTIEVSGPAVHVHTAETSSPPESPSKVSEGLLAASTADETGTQVSSSIDFAKPSSLDGKSVASGTTFTLDEKESLRPDDSASVMAREDEEVFTRQGPGLLEAHSGSDDERQAFSDQLREISDMDVSRPAIHPHGFGHGADVVQGVLYVPPQGPGVGNVPGSLHVASDATQDAPPDPKLLEALDSPKDRIMVLKLEQDIVDFVKDPKESSLKLPQTNAFYRMLAHKLADYYMLGHVVDDSTMAVRIFKTPTCRIPPPLTGIATPSTAASTPPPMGPQMKILRRGVDSKGPTIANGSSFTSKTTSENGESGNEDEHKSRLPRSREEREARYEAARKRIMGSEIPPIPSDELPDKDISRSSSAAGRRGTRKKQRADSDDDFEARSAYSAYYPAIMAQGASTPGGYAVPAGHPQAAPMSPGSYPSPQGVSGIYQQYPSQSNMWPNSTSYAQTPTQTWAQPQQPAYDLSGDFQRNMSFQSRGAVMQSPGAQQPYNTSYTQPMTSPQQPWSQQNNYMATYASQPGAAAYPQGYPSHTPQGQSAFQDSQPYAYGQLPSQAFPGRPPNKLEHPLPGSYKGKHFNPQSQSFIPNQANGSSMLPYQAAHTQMLPYSPVYNALPPRQETTQSSYNASFPSPQPLVAGPTTPSMSTRPPPSGGGNQHLTHPLPQPVFARQPSPNVPLPAKPVSSTPPRPPENKTTTALTIASKSSAGHAHQITSSSIAKWGAPPSLPAKPPVPLNGIPTFGSMPSGPGDYGAGNAQARRM